jgi:hypothetical protein
LIVLVGGARRPGEHVVEVMYSNRDNQSTFPFKIVTIDPTIQGGQTTKVFPGVPDDFTGDAPARAVRVACGIPASMMRELFPKYTGQLADAGPIPDDVDRLADEFHAAVMAYKDDAVVQALVTATPRNDHTVILDLPPELGGKRQFDKLQIHDLVDAIRGKFNLPARDQFDRCEEMYPAARGIYEPLKAISDKIEAQLTSMESLAG